METRNETFNGYTMPVGFQENWKDIENLEVYDDDVWLCGFPKSGTTWSQEMIWCIGNNLDFEAAEEKLYKRFIYLEHSFLFKSDGGTDVPDVHIDSVNLVKNMKRPRYINTHLPWELLPKQITTFAKRPKIICVVQNPMDTCVSLYYYCKLLGYNYDNIELCSQIFLKHKATFTPYVDYVLGYWNRKDEPNILCIKYEEMKIDLSSVIDTVAAFLEKTLPESGKNELISHLSFDSMKKTQTTVPTAMIEFLQKSNGTYDKEGQFLRSGNFGGYHSEMSPETIDIFKREFMDKFEEAGLTFPI